METIELRRPLLVNGKKLTELPCDMDAIGPDEFIRAEALANAKRNNEGSPSSMSEIDYGFHIYLGFEGIMAADQSIDIADLERIRGVDLVRIAGIGRFFALGADGDSTESDSDEPSESTATSTTAAPSK
ncbi:hypothetical protein [Olsenella sp. An293]|uniref:hypothetical protein n=1 Tax=Olsenella sp. An293 TaxID=1965626 RepID=UPI000B3986CF|nr:hypothetical protein [Olsenella sp. An293]OUO32252.1 hypothetical protein B5F85_06865 [Olsenella sp. An293]